MRKRILIALALAAASLSLQTTKTWTIIGPGGGGSMFRPTVSPHDPDTVLIACDMTGAYITYDAGRRWREFNLRARVDSFAFDPADAKVIYAGSSGLFRSEDRGKTWRLVFPDPTAVTRELQVDDHASHRFVSTDNWPGGLVQAIRAEGERIWIGVRSRGGLLLFGSQDRGKTWKQLAAAPGQSFLKLSAHAGRAYVFTDQGVHVLEDGKLHTLRSGTQAGASAGLDPATRVPVFYVTTPARWEEERFHSGVLKSTDLGRTWQEMQSGLEPPRGVTPVFTQIAAAENNPAAVYVGVSRHDGRSFGIFKTEDGGESWRWVMRAGREPVPNRKDAWLVRRYDFGWAGTPWGLGADASGRICYATDSGTAYRTLDGGKTWDQVYSDDHPDGSASSRGLDVTTNYGVHFDPFDRSHLVISYTDIGLFHSLNGGRTWLHSIEGVPRPWINTCYWVVFDPEVKDRAWSVWSYAHDLPRPKMFRAGNFDRYVGGVCRTDDGLKSWKVSNNGMPPNAPSTYIVLDPRSPKDQRTLYVAGFGKGVFKSTDDGINWKLMNEGISGNLNAWQIVLLPDGTLYLLVSRGLAEGREVDGAVYRSKDGAKSWERVRLPEGVNAPNDLVYDPKSPRRMYLAAWPRTLAGVERHGGLYATENGGETWREVFDQSAHVYGVALDPENPRRLWINTFNSAAWRSEDGGKMWHRLEGYNFKWGHRPVLDPHNKGMLFLTTFGSSVWYGPDRGVPGAFEDIFPIGQTR